jgi:VanZ family protein
MDQWQQAPLLTAEILLLSITATLLFVRFNLRVRQSWSALGSTQQRHVIACAVGFTLWVASTKIVRPWASAIGIEGHWILDVAPSLTAGITVTAYVAFLLALIRRLKYLFVFLYGAALMLLAEIMQIWLPDYVFDLLDVLAGTIGAAVVTLFLSRNSARRGTPQNAQV